MGECLINQIRRFIGVQIAVLDDKPVSVLPLNSWQIIYGRAWWAEFELPSGSYYWEETRWVDAVYETQYRYRDAEETIRVVLDLGTFGVTDLY